MVLAGHSNTLYLSESKARSRAGRHFFILHVQQHCKTTKQWHHPHNCTNNQSGHVLSSRGWGWSSLHTLQRGHPLLPYSRIHGPSPTFNTNENGQHHCTWRFQQQHHQKVENNGHEIPLALWQRKLRPISTLLGPRQRKQRRLHDKSSCRHSSTRNAPNFPPKYLYLTSTMPTTHRQTSCSKAVLDIYCTTVWYNQLTYCKLHNESLRPPVHTGTDRDWQSHHIFPVPRKQPLDRNVWYNSS